MERERGEVRGLLASLKCTKSLTIEDSECVEMTFPSFFEKFSNILA